MKKDISFLIIDDDLNILEMLKKFISNAFPRKEIYTSINGLEGWNLIKQHHPSIVISDLALPAKDGLELCQDIRSDASLQDIYFIIITAHAEKERRIELLEKGADDFVSKPLLPDEFLARIKAGIRVVQLQNKMIDENLQLGLLKQELEKDLQDMLRLGVKFMQARIPASYEMLQRISEASVWIAHKLTDIEEDTIRHIEIAGYLSHAGRIFLPDSLVNKPVMIKGMPTDKIMCQVPVSAKEIVSSVPRFADVANILYHVYENIDGSGFPSRLQTWQIPIGSRIIRVVLDYEETLLFTDLKSDKVLESLYQEAGRLYDHRIVTLLEQYTAEVSIRMEISNERPIQLADLAEGMIVSRDIRTTSGLKLVPSGAVLRASTIERVLSHNMSDPIIGNIYIRK